MTVYGIMMGSPMRVYGSMRRAMRVNDMMRWRVMWVYMYVTMRGRPDTV